MAAGEQRRWREHGGEGSKHLLVIEGEALLDRIVRQTLGHDTIISGPYPGHLVPTFQPTTDVDIVDGRLGVRELWSDHSRTVILLGDCWYSDEAMQTILEHPGPEPCLFARFGPSRITGKPWAEPFANSFLPADHNRHESALRQAQAMKDKGRAKRAGLWEAYKLEHGQGGGFTYRTRNLGHAVEIDDWTEDFDGPEDYDRWLDRRAEMAA